VRIQIPKDRTAEFEGWLKDTPTACGGELVAAQKSGAGRSRYYTLPQVSEPYDEDWDLMTATWALADSADVDAFFRCLRSHLGRFRARILPPRPPR
jgi:hypothetical protein